MTSYSRTDFTEYLNLIVFTCLLASTKLYSAKGASHHTALIDDFKAMQSHVFSYLSGERYIIFPFLEMC